MEEKVHVHPYEVKTIKKPYKRLGALKVVQFS
jgi:hypothetical protein